MRILILISILFAGCVTVVPCPKVVQEDPWRYEINDRRVWGYFSRADSVGATYFDGCNTHTHIGNGYETVTLAYCGEEIILDFDLQNTEPDSTNQ